MGSIVDTKGTSKPTLTIKFSELLKLGIEIAKNYTEEKYSWKFKPSFRQNYRLIFSY